MIRYYLAAAMSFAMMAGDAIAQTSTSHMTSPLPATSTFPVVLATGTRSETQRSIREKRIMTDKTQVYAQGKGTAAERR